jgi:peptide/nickel transport system permease protein
MFGFLVQRLISSIILLFVVGSLVFFLVQLGGSDIARGLLGEYATQEQVQAKAEQLGLNRPILERYGEWLTGVVSRFDFGKSWLTSQSVTTAIMSRLPVTLSLVLLTVPLATLLALAFGTLAATRSGPTDRAVQVASVLGLAIPEFITAVVIATIFGVYLGWFRATGYAPIGLGIGAWLGSLILPVTALVLTETSQAAQHFRSAILDIQSRDFVRTLRARGLSDREVLFRHVLRSAAPAGLTLLSLLLMGMMSGSVFVERIFALPGLGSLAVESTARGDIPMMLGVVVWVSLIVITINLIVDLSIGWLNPKARVS